MSKEQLSQLPLDQLEQLVLSSAAELEGLLAGGGSTGGAPAEGGSATPVAPAGTPPVSAPAPAPAPSASAQPAAQVDLSDMEPRDIQSVMSILGIQALTSDMLPALQELADSFAPGLYNVASDHDSLIEFLTGVANGSIPLSSPAPAPSGPAPGGPGPAPGGVAGGVARPAPSGPAV